MSWVQGEHCKKIKKGTLETLAETKGKISMKEAQVWFAKFCKANPSFTVKLLTGISLAPIQDIVIRSFFLRDSCLMIAGRGFSKSFTVSLFIILYAIFNPGCKIGICSGTFRQSKLIFKQIEKFIMNGRHGQFLRQCLTGKMSHSTDAFEMSLGNSIITALPLTEKIRGQRFNLMIIDELLLVPSEIINTVIRPFLTVKQGGLEAEALRKAEDKLIKAGRITEEDRIRIPANKIVGLSSASYKFEPLYKENYEPYVDIITNPKAEDVSHVVFRFSYEATPPGLLDLKSIKEAERTVSKQQFDREYRALFVDDSGGYYDLKAVESATIPVGEEPSLKARGEPGKKYILAIDPNYNASETSDNFAMAVLELNEENRSGTLVHAYAVCNNNTEKNALYLRYLLKNFNFHYIIIDNAGGPKFISDSKTLLRDMPDLQLFEHDFLNGDEGIRNSKNNYNYINKKIVHSQAFSVNGWIRLANETLQANIEHKRLTFGSRIFLDKDFSKIVNDTLPIKEIFYRDNIDTRLSEKGLKEDFADHLNMMLEQTKKELTMIEVSTNAAGHQTFDLPKNVKMNTGPSRARRDSYTALLLANWGMYCYYKLMDEPSEDDYEIFRPKWIV
jgi:hypothetical protein